jgi:hypothetical protein
MSRPEFGDDERQLRPREEDSSRDPVAWLSAVFYYGLGQVLFLGLPALWMAFLAPVRRLQVVDATVVGMVFVPLVIAAGRLGILGGALDRFGLRWPTLGGTTLGVVGSFRVYLTRSTLLNATFMWVAYGTVWLSLWVDPFPWFEVAATIAVASTVAYPWLSTSTLRARLARVAFQLGGVGVLLAVVDLARVVESGFVRYPAVLGLALFLVVLDARPLVADLRRE